jgi:trigger factor
MASVSRESIGNLNDKILVSLSKDDYMPSFEKAVKQLAKTANLPGFRKGMVPPSVIKKKYGNSLFADEVLKTVEKELNQYITEEKLDIFGQPLPLNDKEVNLNIDEPANYEFAFEIGLKPEIEIQPQQIEVTRYQIEITSDMIQEQVEKLQESMGRMIEKEIIEQPADRVEFSFLPTQSFATNEQEENKEPQAQNYTLYVSDFNESVQQQLIGKTKGNTLQLTLNNAFSDAFEKEDKKNFFTFLGLDINDNVPATEYEATILKIEGIQKAELNEELFKKVFPNKEIPTEEEFRNAIKAELEKMYEKEARNQMHHTLYHKLLDTVTINFPEEFLKRWLKASSKEPKTDEEIEQSFPSFLNQLKWNLISAKIISENNITITEEELKEAARQQTLSYLRGAQMEDMPWLEEYVNRMMSNKEFVENIYFGLQEEKLFQLLDTQVNIHTETISKENFEAMLHQHHHEHEHIHEEADEHA